MKEENKYLYSCGEKINGLTITSQVRHGKNNNKSYHFVCDNCGYKSESPIREDVLKRGGGCKVCCTPPRMVVKEINSIWATHNHLVKYFVNKEDAYVVSKGSDKKVKLKCQDCGEIKFMRVSQLVYQSFACGRCSDGISYPNKFMYALLKQLEVEFETEFKPKWAIDEDNIQRRYDFYVPSKNLIIEMDGGWHYRDNKMSNQLLEDTINIDAWKSCVATNNGIRVVRIDCDISELGYIKTNILESNIATIFECDNVDWIKCSEFATKSMTMDVCGKFNKGMSISDISNETKLSRHTIRKYLKLGRENKWCEYDEAEVSREVRASNGIKNGKRVKMFKDGVCIGSFRSCLHLSNISEEILNGIHLIDTSISRVCRGERDSYMGYTFKYVE